MADRRNEYWSHKIRRHSLDNRPWGMVPRADHKDMRKRRPAMTNDYLKSLTEAWTSTGNALSTAQQQFFKQLEKAPVLPFPIFPMSADLEGANAAFRQLLASAIEIPQAVAKEAGADGKRDAVTIELLQKVLDPRSWLAATGYMDDGLRRIVEGPKLADVGQLEAKFFAVMKALGESRAAIVEQNTLLLTAWSRAANDFLEEFSKAANGRPFGSRTEMVALWVDTANHHLLEMERSAGYLDNQRKLLRSTSALKLAQQELSDLYSETFGFPTRTEIDDLTRTVAELKREVRADKRARQTFKGGAA